MAAFAQQDMSYYTSDYMRTEGTFVQRLSILESVRDLNRTGIGEFYHEALKYLLLRSVDIGNNRDEQEAAERSVVILSQGLGAEKYTAAAGDLWQAVVFTDIVKRTTNDANAVQAALIALGQVDGRDFIDNIIDRLNIYNIQNLNNAETRRRYQTAVIGCINALETLKDTRGYRPVFFASVGRYDQAVRAIASNALPNIADDPGDIISAIIQDPSSNPTVKLEAWNQMLRTRAPNASKARVAATALATGWNFSTTNRDFLVKLGEMRKSAIDAIRQFGVADSSVYADLERSYSRNFTARAPDSDEIMFTLNTLAAVKSEEAVDLLYKFLYEIHTERRMRGRWGENERQIYQWLVACLGITGTRSPEVRLLLTTINRTDRYTPFEQGLARNALTALGY